MKKLIEILGLSDISKKDLLHPSRFLYALLFSLMSLMFMTYMPKVIARYVHIDYYTVQQPVAIDKEVYRSGDRIVATIIRTSKLNMTAHSTVQLFLFNEKGEIWKFDPLYDGNIVVEKSNNMIAHLTYTLPIDIPEGKYYIKAIIEYPNPNDVTLRVTYCWITNVFSISNTLIELD